MTEFTENTFSDITFEQIDIEKCSSLKTINENAFATTNQVTRSIYIENNPKLSDLSIYTTMNKFAKAELLSFQDNNITDM